MCAHMSGKAYITIKMGLFLSPTDRYTHTHETNYLWCIVCAFRIATISIVTVADSFAGFLISRIFLLKLSCCCWNMYSVHFVGFGFIFFSLRFHSNGFSFGWIMYLNELEPANALVVDLGSLKRRIIRFI